MDTREEIIRLGDSLIRARGYNAFSFSDISKKLNIRNASIHYHFPTKTALGVAVVKQHQDQLAQLKMKVVNKDPVAKLKAFLGIYSTAKVEKKICIVGSLATDLYTVDPEIQDELKKLVDNILDWITDVLQEGKKKKVFHFSTAARTQALMITTSMLASVQLTRLTSQQDFERIKEGVIDNLTKEK